MHKLLENNLNKILKNRHKNTTTFSALLLSACGSGGGQSTSSSSATVITGDPFIDGLTFGTKFDGHNINFAVSGGMNGEYWKDPEAVLEYFQEIVSNTLKFTNITASSVGSFSSPIEASAAGSDVTLVPYYVNEYGIPYGVLGFAFPIGMDRIPEFSGFPTSYSGQEGDIFINFGGILSDVNLSFAPGAEGYLMVLHEFGHSLGLKHPHNTINGRLSFGQYNTSRYDLDEYTVMSYNDDSNSYVAYDPITPMVLDVIALQYLYGKNMSVNSGNTDHNIVHTGEYYSIWDPSGHDTINLSNSKWDWYVELPYVISSGIHGEYVGVALTNENYSAPTDLIWLIGEIEDIIGGSGDDILVGNHLNNNISGGLGNDIIYGMGANNLLIGGSGRDHFTISYGGSQNVIHDFNLEEDTWSIIDQNGNDVSNLNYVTTYNANGDLEYNWTDGTSLVFQGLKETPIQQYSYLFKENDDVDTSDYDFVILNTQEGKFTIHVEDFNYFELLHADISDGSGRLQFAIYYTDLPSEDPSYVSPGTSGFNWRNAESITVQHGTGLQKTITVTSNSLKTISLDIDYDYIGFLVFSDNYWAGDEFLIADAIV